MMEPTAAPWEATQHSMVARVRLPWSALQASVYAISDVYSLGIKRLLFYPPPHL